MKELSIGVCLASRARYLTFFQGVRTAPSRFNAQEEQKVYRGTMSRGAPVPFKSHAVAVDADTL